MSSHDADEKGSPVGDLGHGDRVSVAMSPVRKEMSSSERPHHKQPPSVVTSSHYYHHPRRHSFERDRPRSAGAIPNEPQSAGYKLSPLDMKANDHGAYLDRPRQCTLISTEDHESATLLYRGNQPAPSPDVVSASELEPKRVDEEKLKTMRSELRNFYKHQNDVIAGLLEMEAFVHDVARINSESRGATDERQSASNESHSELKRVRYAVTVSFVVNICLFGLKVVAAITSGSLAVIASALDSLLDLLSGSILYFLSKAIHKRDPYKYPVSKSRLEPVGIIVFAAVMGMTSLHILEDGVEDIVHGLQGEPRDVDVDVFTLVVLFVTIVSKLCLYIYCTYLNNGSSVVDALVQDHRNDVATNSLGVVSAFIAARFRSLWYVDAVGAIVLSSYIIFTWVAAGKDQIAMLVGKTATSDLIGQLVYLAAHHDARILRVDKVLAYHFGIRYMCEVDIVLPEDMPLKESHDIGESLEIQIERLTMVERAFVHLDYEWTHRPEHKVL